MFLRSLVPGGTTIPLSFLAFFFFSFFFFLSLSVSVGGFGFSLSSCRSSLLSLAIVVTIWSCNWRPGWLTGVVLLTAVPGIVGGDEVEVDAPVDDEGAGAGEIGFGVEGAHVGRGSGADEDLFTNSSPTKTKTPWSLWSSSMLATNEATRPGDACDDFGRFCGSVGELSLSARFCFRSRL